MSKYLVTLKPIDAFFFGGERGFGFYDRKDKKKELENNIIKSMKFPQQTSILGMLRKEVLVIKKLIKEDWNYDDSDRKEIYTSIGKKSFDLNEKEQDFGAIKNISPVFIAQLTENAHKFLMGIPKDHDKLSETAETMKYTPLRFNKKYKCKCNVSEEIYLPINFDAKKGISEDFIDISNGCIVKSEDIFKVHNYIGINVNHNKMTDDNSLFRLVKYKFNYDMKYKKQDKVFIFTVEIEDSLFNEEQINKLQSYTNVVSLGGESSYFSMKFEKVDFHIIDKIKCLNNESECYKKLVLISDTYINNDDYNKYCEHSIANSIDFRNIARYEYKNTKENYYYKSFSKNKNKHCFLERGSVLFVKKENYDSLIKSINNKNLKKIGYNTFI